MTDRQTLSGYRFARAKETLADAEKLLRGRSSPESAVNRAYYAMFYAVWALLLRSEVDLKTSKHTGIISLFDKEFVHTGKIDPRYSKMLHEIFESRLDGDYKEMAVLTEADALEAFGLAKAFLAEIGTRLNEQSR